MKVGTILLIVLNSSVLLIYPFVLLANLMGLAAIPQSGATPLATALVAYGFMGLTTLYPIAYVAGLVGTLVNFPKNLRVAWFWQWGVVGYLALTGALLTVWLMLE